MSTARRALVTGVGTGIGRAVAAALLGDGWNVVGVYNRSSREAEELAREHPALRLERADISDPAEVRRLVEVATAGPGLDALVNNAGTLEFERPGSFDAELWRRTFAVNLLAPAELAYSIGEAMAPGSAIVNVTSTDGLGGSYSSPAYAASKAALASVTRSLANVLGPKGVRVNAVSPGWIETSMADKAAEQAAALTPLGRLGSPEEVADCVRWLLGEGPAFVHGSTVTLDGGLANADYVLLRESRVS